jgi:pimeloyl-ACP methyl ester carboxylesterase
MFERQIPLLAQDRMLVIPDRIGFGHSDRLASPISIPDYALATVDALDALGIDVVDAIGIHTGSVETIELAVQHPGRVRRAGVVAIPVLTPEQAEARKGRHKPPPEPALDGSHLTWFWEWWMAVRTPDWDLPLLQQRVFDHMWASPHVWWTYHAVFDYPTAERLSQIRQPFLLLAPHDDLWAETQQAIPHLPPQTTYVELPHLQYEVFTLAADEIAGHIRAFLD